MNFIISLPGKKFTTKHSDKQDPVPKKSALVPENFDNWMDETMSSKFGKVLESGHDKDEINQFVGVLRGIATTQAVVPDAVKKPTFTSEKYGEVVVKQLRFTCEKYGEVVVTELKVHGIACLESSIDGQSFTTGSFSKIESLQIFLMSELSGRDLLAPKSVQEEKNQ